MNKRSGNLQLILSFDQIKVVTASVPDDSDHSEEPSAYPETEGRESIRMQALLAKIGEPMETSVWIPKNDRNPVLGNGTLLTTRFLIGCR